MLRASTGRESIRASVWNFRVPTWLLARSVWTSIKFNMTLRSTFPRYSLCAGKAYQCKKNYTIREIGDLCNLLIEFYARRVYCTELPTHEYSFQIFMELCFSVFFREHWIHFSFSLSGNCLWNCYDFVYSRNCCNNCSCCCLIRRTKFMYKVWNFFLEFFIMSLSEARFVWYF